MYVINLDEKKLYEFAGEKGAEEIMNDMFKAYFQKTYQESTVKSLVKDMWEHIELKIPKKVEVFLRKDKMLYYIGVENADEDENKHEDEDEYEDEFVRFEVAPRFFFKMKKDAHKVWKKCFEECNEKFARTMQNITSETGWESTSFTIMNVRCRKYPICIQCKCEDFEDILKDKQQNFEKFVGKSLKEEKLCKEVALKMLKRYRKILLENNPIMFITNAETEEIYAIDNKLVAKRVPISSIQEDLETIVSEILPSDYDFLVNRIYNYLVFPKEEISAQIRIKKVNDNGLSGVIYVEKETFPIVRLKQVCSEEHYFTIVPIKPNENKRSFKERLLGSSISLKPTICKDIIAEIDASILPEYGYIEVVSKKYYYYYYGNNKISTGFNQVYILENGVMHDVFGYKTNKINEEDNKKIKEFYKREKNSVHYAFFEVIFKS